MAYPCETIRDLLPLYIDKVCSAQSRNIVDEHLGGCADCQDVLQKMQNSAYSDHLRNERESVVGHYAKKVKRKSLTAGLCMAAILAVPILVCLIVNLATDHALNWFFIVLTALLVFASLTVVPLVAETRKGLYTLGSFTASLLLLLLTCSIYTGAGWFWVAAIPVVFGLAVVFMPYVLHALPLKGFAAKNKGLISMAVDTVLLYAVVIESGLYTGAQNYWRSALLITTFCASFAWLLFAVIRYLPANGLTRGGISVIVTGVMFAVCNDVIVWILEGTFSLSMLAANLTVWQQATFNPNTYLIALLSCCILGAALLVAGFFYKRAKAKK